METIIIIWLIVSVLASVLVVAALMLSSRLSQEEGLSESYEEWQAREEEAQKVYLPQTEQQ